MKKLFLLVMATLIATMCGCCMMVDSNEQQSTESKAIIEKIAIDSISSNPCPTIDCPSAFFITVNVTASSEITVNDITFMMSKPNVVSAECVELNAYKSGASMKMKISVIGEDACEFFIQNKEGTIKSNTIEICGMSMDGLAEFVLESDRKIVHKRNCENVHYIKIDKRKYINESDFHYDYRKCDDCMS